MLVGDNMINMESRIRKRGLRQAAIFTTSAGPLSHLSSQLIVHQAEVVRARTARALAWKMVMRSIASISSLYSWRSSSDS